MEKELGSWFRYQQSELQSPYPNLSDPLVVRGNNSVPACMNPYMEVSANGAFPMSLYSGLPRSKANQPIEPCNWFHCMPHFRQAFVPPFVPMPKEKAISGQMDNCGMNGSVNAVSASIQKSFLVFDQSGDQTKLIYSSVIPTPTLYLNSWNPQQRMTCDVVKEELLIKENAIPQILPSQNLDVNHKYPEDGMNHEMHEDTEELNALLYSDDENEYSEDDEVTSTGHSPSTVVDHGIQHLSVEGDEEVESSAGSTKRQKLLDGAHTAPHHMRIVVPENPFKSSELADEAESCCGNFDGQVSGESFPVSGKKRSRKEKIRRTLSILQNVVPGAKGKKAAVVIDEAVQYLKLLKKKAKSLGLDTP